MDSSPHLTRWCHDLANALTRKTGDTLRVRPNGSALTFECAWDATGTAILATSIKLPFPAARFSRTTSPRDFAETIWALIGSWSDFNLHWLDQQRAA